MTQAAEGHSEDFRHLAYRLSRHLHQGEGPRTPASSSPARGTSRVWYGQCEEHRTVASTEYTGERDRGPQVVEVPKDPERELTPELWMPFDKVGEVPPLQVLTQDSRQGVRLDRVIDDRVRSARDANAGSTCPQRKAYVLTGDGALVEATESLQQFSWVKDVAGLCVRTNRDDRHRPDMWSRKHCGLERVRARSALDDSPRYCASRGDQTF